MFGRKEVGAEVSHTELPQGTFLDASRNGVVPSVDNWYAQDLAARNPDNVSLGFGGFDYPRVQQDPDYQARMTAAARRSRELFESTESQEEMAKIYADIDEAYGDGGQLI